MTDSTARTYLVHLYGENPHGLIWIGGSADGFKGRTFETVDASVQYAMELDARGGMGVYHRSTTLAIAPDSGRGTAEDSGAAYFFALDGDIKGPGHKAPNLPESFADLEEMIARAGFPEPTAWVASGGGFYPQWRFTEPIDVRGEEERKWVTDSFTLMADHFIQVAKELGWRLDNVRDLPRVFRLPGTTNRKTSQHVVASVVEGAGSGETFDLGVLASKARRAGPIPTVTSQSDLLFDEPSSDHRHTEEQAKKRIEAAFQKMKAVLGPENFNTPINHFAKFCSHFPWLVSRDECARIVTKALTPHGRTASDNDYLKAIHSAYASTESNGDWIAEKVEAAQATDDRLKIGSPADMAYWLEANAGRGKLSGFFSRAGQMVHTPRINELGYVGDASNGPAEIRPVGGGVLAAKIQYLYRCYKVVKDKDTVKEVAAMFPRDAASVAVEASEALGGLRELKGITSTPMVRADGSLLSAPGYDDLSGYLFLPGEGVAVPAVPEAPDRDDVERARKLLLGMISDFPFDSDDDRANYLGLLLTPLLRQVVPPSYKLFGIGAHQPGSGKSLLAEIAGLIHGSVMRSEVPEDEAEWRKQTFSILSTTSAPLVVLDNIMGVLKSSTLAGVLTAGREITDRELGSSKTITVANDRVWVVTGNNLSLGGDMVRRTITILINPDRPDPEQRVDFAVPDLKAWVADNRNEILHALLVLVRAWVVAGMPEPARKQSDSFARWERVVAGVLKVGGVAGEFDKESGKRAAVGGDDDGLFTLLSVLRDRFGDTSWRASEALEVKDGKDGWLMESRDWLPSVVLEKLGRNEGLGRKSFGRWLRNRVGRWVTADGVALVLREGSRDKQSQFWSIEQR